MTETATEPTQTPAVQKDENGIEALTGQYESWHFIDPSHDFYARFRRLVSIADTQYAEVDHSNYANSERKVRYCRLTEFAALANCEEGDDLHCRWILHKPYVFAAQSCKRGRVLTQKEWDEISFAPGMRYCQNFPNTYARLVEA